MFDYFSVSDVLYDWGIWLLNSCIDLVDATLIFVASILPVWEFDISLGNTPLEMLGVLSWFFPVNHFIYCVNMYVWSIILYFSFGIITRWLKVTQ